MSEAATVLADLWRLAEGDPAALDQAVLSGGDPILPGTFEVGTAALASIAASGVAAAELWRLRSGEAQTVSVDARSAAAAFRSERYLRVAGHPVREQWLGISGFYQAGDGRWIQLHCNFPHHRDGVLRMLGCPDDRAAVAAAVRGWTAAALEASLVEAGLCAAFVRTPDEWHAHPQSQALAELPLFEILKLGDSPPEPRGSGDRPLSGLRVLDLTRVIAGPVCGRTLASHGADVLLISGPHLPSMEPLVMDTGLGKRSAFLDLRRADEAARLGALIRDADVFVQSYRPGALAELGLAPEELIRARPGLIYVSLCAYSHAGPWRARRGFDSLVQSASGIAHEGGGAAGLDEPRHLPAQALDHASGYLLAFGAMVALHRRAREGGSYLVRVSLAQTGRWIDNLGRVDGRSIPDLSLEDVADLLQTTDTPFGKMRHIAPPARLSATPARWDRPSVPLGTHRPEWPDFER